MRNSSSQLTRRRWLRWASCGLGAASASPWLKALADETADHPERKRACILLWMPGGPSQLDTFDPKPEHENGGPVRAIETAVSGIRISEYLPQLARQMKHMAVLRSMSTREGDHSRATYHLKTGYSAAGAIRYPTLGSLLCKELGDEDAVLPNFVSIAPDRTRESAGPGFLGPKYAALEVGATDQRRGDLRVTNLARPANVTQAQADARAKLLSEAAQQFNDSRPGPLTDAHAEAYRGAQRLMQPQAASAFELDKEPRRTRDAYGRNAFGQGCLLARRLVERGVPFVEVDLGGFGGNANLNWDTHRDNFTAVGRLCNILDPAWATLLEDLHQRCLLETTLVVWMGEFGRTPQINRNTGRDHYPQAWSTVLCGGGIRGGQVVGATSDSGMQVADRPIAVPDLLATIIKALGVDPMGQNMSNVGRPIRLADPEARLVEEVLL